MNLYGRDEVRELSEIEELEVESHGFLVCECCGKTHSESWYLEYHENFLPNTILKCRECYETT